MRIDNIEELWYSPDFDQVTLHYIPKGYYGKIFHCSDEMDAFFRRYNVTRIDPVGAGWIKLCEYPLQDNDSCAEDEDHDPTLWCSACGAKIASQCKCGPIAENE